jgi:hypothetical protein
MGMNNSASSSIRKLALTVALCTMTYFQLVLQDLNFDLVWVAERVQAADGAAAECPLSPKTAELAQVLAQAAPRALAWVPA